MKRIAILLLILLLGTACAEDNVWVMCKTYANVRMRPSTGSQVIGRIDSGEGLETDWVRKGNWLHLVNLSLECSEGWIHAGYVVESVPERGLGEAIVTSNARVALRSTVGGKRRAWVKDGDILKVLWQSDEWSLTNRGYIKSEYLEGMQK